MLNKIKSSVAKNMQDLAEVKANPHDFKFVESNRYFEDELPGEKNLNYLTASAT